MKCAVFDGAQAVILSAAKDLGIEGVGRDL
jgi:hypothetical protein